jgi:hypothetical protein
VQLLHYCDIQLLLSDENFNVSTPERRRHSHVEQSLCEPAAPDEKALYSALTGPVTRLNASRRAQFGVSPDDGTKNQPLPSRLFKTRFRFLDRGIFFECGLENAFQGNGVRCVAETNYEKRDKKVNNGPL